MSDVYTELAFGGILLSVVVDDLKVPHYGIEYDETAKLATSWIVSETDKPFVIRIKLNNRLPGENYNVRVYLDGHRVASRVKKPNHLPDIEVSSIQTSATQKRAFMFGSLELSDDDALLESSSVIALGEIQVELIKVGTLIERPVAPTFTSAPQIQKIHERAKKGLSHNVKYGEIQENAESTIKHTYNFRDEIVLATHIVKYRPLTMLQANGIVPYVPEPNSRTASNSPSPPPVQSASTSKKRKVTDPEVKPEVVSSEDELNSDDDDIDERKKALMDQIAELEKLKAKRRKKVKREPVKKESVKEEPAKFFLPGEIIDLTI